MIDTLPVHHLARVLSLLRHSWVVAFPTGTTYGLAVNALDRQALQRLSDLKGRSPEKTYSLLLPTRTSDDFVELAAEERAALTSLADRPLTLLVRARPPLRDLAKDGRVGIRTPDHPFTKELVELLPFPITATSANQSGALPALSVADLVKGFPSASFMAVDGGTLPENPPSTVARWTGSAWEILREGEVRLKDLQDIGALGSPKRGQAPTKKGV